MEKKEINTYVLPWRAGETLRTRLSFLTLVSLFRVRRRSEGRQRGQTRLYCPVT